MGSLADQRSLRATAFPLGKLLYVKECINSK